jgi:hypothetical protein
VGRFDYFDNSKPVPLARPRSEMEMAKHYNSTKARRDSSNIDNLGDALAQELATFQAHFPNRDVLNGGALTPAGIQKAIMRAASEMRTASNAATERRAT